MPTTTPTARPTADTQSCFVVGPNTMNDDIAIICTPNSNHSIPRYAPRASTPPTVNA